MDNVIVSTDDSALISQPAPLLVGEQQPVIVQENFVGGANSTIHVGLVETLPAGSQAYVQNVGTETDAVFNFGIPEGEQGIAGEDGSDGQNGEAATITIGSVTTGAAGSNVIVENVGTDTDAILNFTIPRGEQGLRGETGATGQDGVTPIAYVTQTSTGATIHIEDAQTVTDATVTNGTDGTDGFSPIATVTQNTGSATISITDENGTTTATVYDGTDGTDGTDGQDGAAATITVGTVTTGAAGSAATVTNVGTSNAAIFDFSIPKGDTGATGTTGATPNITMTASVDNTTGTPAVTVTKTGTDTNPNIDLAFEHLKGDTGATGQGFVDYSTSEVDTGIKWVDGKTIYRKVISTSTYTAPPSYYSLGVHVDTFINIYGFVQRIDYPDIWQPIPSRIGDANYSVSFRIGERWSGIQIDWGAAWANNMKSLRIVVEYTKA